MHEELAELVYPVIARGLRLREQLRRGEPVVFEVEQSDLQELLRQVAEAPTAAATRPGAVPAESEAPADAEPFLGVAYPLAGWLDELIVLDSPWRARWNENKLEAAFFGTNDRAWKFWRQAALAAGRTDDDPLEVFFLAAMLGFRGDWAEEPEKLEAWVAATRARLARGRGRDWVPPPELEPPADVPPRLARGRLRRMAVAGGVLLMLAIPTAAVYIGRYLGQ